MIRQRIIMRGLAGHSHYHNTRHRKARVDADRQSAFQKLSREIYASIKTGGSSDPKANTRLARAIELARRKSMPKERIERALRTADVTAREGIAVFEGSFPGGVGVVVRASGGRRNAVAGELRGLFHRAGGEMGRVGWMFVEKLAVVVPSGGEDVALLGIEEGAEDVEILDDSVEVFCNSVAGRERIRKQITERFGYDSVYGVRRMESRWVVEVDGTQREKLQRLFEELDDHDDVVEVIHNAEFR